MMLIYLHICTYCLKSNMWCGHRELNKSPKSTALPSAHQEARATAQGERAPAVQTWRPKFGSQHHINLGMRWAPMTLSCSRQSEECGALSSAWLQVQWWAVSQRNKTRGDRWGRLMPSSGLHTCMCEKLIPGPLTHQQNLMWRTEWPGDYPVRTKIQM